MNEEDLALAFGYGGGLITGVVLMYFGAPASFWPLLAAGAVSIVAAIGGWIWLESKR